MLSQSAAVQSKRRNTLYSVLCSVTLFEMFCSLCKAMLNPALAINLHAQQGRQQMTGAHGS
jgi:hypothetical protein